jgi:hypothetical protein
MKNSETKQSSKKLTKTQLSAMKQALTQKLSRSKDIQDSSSLLTDKLSKSQKDDKNAIYAKVTTLCKQLEVEVIPDLVQLMGKTSDFA